MDSDIVQQIAELVEFAEITRRGEVQVIRGKTYWVVNGKIERVIVQEPARSALQFATLFGLCDYIKADPDGVLPTEGKPLLLHVVGPSKVFLFGPTREDDVHSREIYAVAKHEEKPFPFGSYLDRETFNVAIQAQFDQSQGAWAEVLALIGNIIEENAVTTQDNGYSQGAVAKVGVISGAPVIVPNPVELAPFRSFPEIEPVKSKFILRIQGGKGAPVKCALFEADGGGWAVETSNRIFAELASRLAPVVSAGKLIVVR